MKDGDRPNFPPRRDVRYPKQDEQPRQESVLREPEAAYMVDRVRDGLSFMEFTTLRRMLDLTEDQLGELVGIPKATLHRRKKAGHLDRLESDRLVRYGRLFQRAVAALGDEEGAREWLRTPGLAFHDETPLSYADTEVGAREVEALLGRIEHGVFS